MPAEGCAMSSHSTAPSVPPASSEVVIDPQATDEAHSPPDASAAAGQAEATRRVVTTLLLSPGIGVALARGKHPALADDVGRFLGMGVTVLLTVSSGREGNEIATWFRTEVAASGAASDNLRLATPGTYHWPGGVLRLPYEANVTADAVIRAGAVVSQNLSQAGRDVRLEDVSPHDDYLSISSPAPLDPAWIGRVWDACNARETLLVSDPNGLQPVRHADGSYSTVISPEVPSLAWYSVCLAELIEPHRLVVCRSRAEVEDAAMDAFRDRLEDFVGTLPGGDRTLPPSLEVDLDDATAGLRLPGQLIAATRIASPSSIHFIKRWTEENRRYVRRHYWEASKRASENEAEAEKVLAGLDAQRFARAANLVDLARRTGGRRLFDDYSGGVCFEPGHYEFEVPSATGPQTVDRLRGGLLSYFDEKLDEMPFDRPLLKRRLFTNSLILLRGEAYYANLKKLPPWARAREYGKEADALAAAVTKMKGDFDLGEAIRNVVDGGEATLDCWKLLVAFFDQARNLGLTMLSVASHRWGERRDPGYDESLVKQAVRLVEAFYVVLLGDRRGYGQSSLVETLTDAAVKGAFELRSLADQEEARARTSEWYEPGAPIRGWREADNPYENLLTTLLAMSQETEPELSAALGMFWGGVELPLVAKVASDALGKPLTATGFIRYGRYSASAAREERVYCDLALGRWREVGELAQAGVTRTILLDDNSLSGATLEAGRDMLLLEGMRKVETWVVRFSGERREGQMRMANGGIVHPPYLNAGLKGFLHETPYARSYSRKDYESPVGVFDTARSRVLRYLHNNGFATIFDREGF